MGCISKISKGLTAQPISFTPNRKRNDCSVKTDCLSNSDQIYSGVSGRRFQSKLPPTTVAYYALKLIVLASCVEEKDASKAMDWKSMGDPASSESGEGAAVKKRLPIRIRQIPDYYFLPRKSLPSAVLFYGSWTVAGLGAGMLTEVWINKKVKEDGGVIWEFGK